ncbi:unnamed protein product, partial [Dovyalis caffra]
GYTNRCIKERSWGHDGFEKEKGRYDWAEPCGFQDHLNPYLSKTEAHNSQSHATNALR